ncbi:MAG: ATP-dependent DNA helicase [Acidimicrobiales bacterium]|nr:ATP-dependent DNA helicase [Acidimicrobiales bacterium]
MGLSERTITALASVTSELPGGGEQRPGQAEMSGAVADAITNESHLIAAAGTGTGKSLAYLVPTILSGKRTVIATATKALQDQLANKDLPFLEEHLDVPFEFSVLKGRSNYVCRQRLTEIADEGNQLGLDGVDDSVNAEDLEEILEWVERTPTGDRAELAFEPSGRTWGAVSVGPTECPGAKKCPMGGECFAEDARARAHEADIVVVNTHLYALNLVTDGAILGEHDVAVLDEAHQIEDIVANAAGFELTSGRLRALANTIKAIVADDKLISELFDAGDQLGLDLEPFTGNRLQEDDFGGDLLATLNRTRDKASSALDALRKIPKDSSPEVIGRKERATMAATHLVMDIDVALEMVEGTVAWVERGRSSPSLKVASIDVSGVLEEHLWTQRTAILTSATIPKNLPERLGMNDFPHEEIDVGSPFDFESAGLLYCAAHMPDPRHDDYRDMLHAEVESLIMAAGGRTLALFTSWRAMNEAKDYLIDRLPYQLLAQGDLPKQVLVDSFLDDEESVLLATMSFWQGVDIPGRALSCVIIDRLPFPRPDDPLLGARRDQVGSAAFREIDIPRAAMLLAQGAGRLIRSADDRGVVAVLDSRLSTKKSYRWELINALPPLRRTKDRDETLDFLKTIRDGV